MALDMRDVCERYGNALSPEGEAYICSFECTFCAPMTFRQSAQTAAANSLSVHAA
jgi:hypothetical protein